MADTPFLNIDLDPLRGGGPQLRQALEKALRKIDAESVPLSRRLSFIRFRGLRAQWASGQLARNLVIGVHGDSTAAGEDSTASPTNSMGINSPASQLARKLKARGYNAGANNLFGSQGCNDIADLKNKESRFDYGGAAVLGSQQCLGGASFLIGGPSNATGWISWTPTDNVTKFVVYWRDDTTGRNFNWQVDGGATTQVNSTGTVQFNKTVVSAGTAGIHTLRLNWVAGTVNIYAIDAYDDTGGRTEISVWNLGARGATSANLLGNVGAPNSGRIAQMQYMPPDLLLSNCGIINDWNSPVANGVTPAVSRANMITMFDTFNPLATMIFMTPPHSNNSNNNSPIQEQYVTAMREVAVLKGAPLLDIRRSWGSFAEAAAAGFLATDVHPKKAGYSDEMDQFINLVGF